MARGDNITTGYTTGTGADPSGTDIPQVGNLNTAAMASLVTIITELMNRSEAKVTAAELNVNGTVDFSTNPAENLTYLELVTQGSAPSANETIYSKLVGSVDELFYKDSAGTEVQITDGGSLSVTTGSDITGAGYGSGGVAINWNAAGTNYQFKSGAGADDYAVLTAHGLQIWDGSSHNIQLESPSLAASYTLTFPAAATAGLVTSDGSGTLSFETTIPDALTFTGVTNFSGTYLQNQQHGEVARFLPHSAGLFGSSVSASVTSSGSSFTITTPDGTANYYAEFPLLVREGERITEVGCYVNAESLSSNATWGLYSSDITAGSWAADTTGTISTTGAITLTPNSVATDSTTYSIRFQPPNTSGGLTINAVWYKTDKII